MRNIFLIALTLALGACMTGGDDNLGPSEPTVRGVEGGICNQKALMAADGLVGRPASTELAKEMLELSGAGTLHWIPKGAFVTTEYREDRLRVQLDENNHIVSYICG